MGISIYSGAGLTCAGQGRRQLTREEPKNGVVWETNNKERIVNHCRGKGGFLKEPSEVLLAKTAGLVFGGRYFFALATTYHLFRLAEGILACAEDMFERFQFAKEDDPAIDLDSFIDALDDEIYEVSYGSMKKAGVSFLCLVPFLFVPNPLSWFDADPLGCISIESPTGYCAWMGFAAYSIYHPQFPQTVLSTLEKWMKYEGGGAAPGKRASEKSSGIGRLLARLFEDGVPLSYWLGWQRVEVSNHEGGS